MGRVNFGGGDGDRRWFLNKQQFEFHERDSWLFTWMNLDEYWDENENQFRRENDIDMYHRERHLPVHVRISYDF